MRRPTTGVEEVTPVESIAAASRMYTRLTDVEHFATQTEVRLQHMQEDVTATKRAVSEVKTAVSDLSGLVKFSRNALTLLVPLAMLAVGIVTLSLKGC